MIVFKRLMFMVTAILLSVTAFNQGTDGKMLGMADHMRSDGRIYVVVAVMVTILTGLVLYMVRVDRKLTRLEKAGKQS